MLYSALYQRSLVNCLKKRKECSNIYPILNRMPTIVNDYERRLNHLCNAESELKDASSQGIMREMLKTMRNVVWEDPAFGEERFELIENLATPFVDAFNIKNACKRPKLPTINNTEPFINHKIIGVRISQKKAEPFTKAKTKARKAKKQ